MLQDRELSLYETSTSAVLYERLFVLCRDSDNLYSQQAQHHDEDTEFALLITWSYFMAVIIIARWRFDGDLRPLTNEDLQLYSQNSHLNTTEHCRDLATLSHQLATEEAAAIAIERSGLYNSNDM